MNIKKIHHVAYRCRDAKETVNFYQSMLDMDLMLVFSEEKVPSTKEENPYMHVFLDAGMGNVLAFFELPDSPEMGRDINTPEWVQHIAFEVFDMDSLLNTKSKIEEEGLEVLGPIDHGIFKSIYFIDPSGHRLELTVNMPISKDEIKKLHDLAPTMLEEWDRTKRPPKDINWLHAEEMKKN